jgi:3-methyladenine DNA glycosylase/8-oxoguanine DNA glycosylase
MRLDGGEVWRATRTPEGPATTRIEGGACEVVATAWGPGAAWALDALPALIGAFDDPSALRPRDHVVKDLHRRFSAVRMCRSDSLVEAAVPSIVEQRVTSSSAHRSFRALVRAFGEPAPGPGHLMLPPDPDALAAAPYYAFHPLGIERVRAETIRGVCRHRAMLGRAAKLGPEDARGLLIRLPGVGPWTAAEVTRVALGDPDAVSVGDFHTPHLVTWALAGEPRGDDARMLELLRPYSGQRGRVVRLLELGARRPPRRVPGRRLLDIAAM